MKKFLGLKNKNNSNSKEKNYIKFSFFIGFYSLVVFALGVTFQKKGAYGLIIKPIFNNLSSIPSNLIIASLVDEDPLIIDINKKNNDKLEETRKKAIKQGELIINQDNWVPFKGSKGNNKFTGKINLKGFTSEHWGDKERSSYKMKLKRDTYFQGIKKFEIQHPKTRSFMNEWHFNKLLKYFGVIAIRYDFTPLILNGKKYPIYAFEEGFGKQLLVNNNRREGPIFNLRNEKNQNFPSNNIKINFYEENYYSSEERKYLIERVKFLISGFQTEDLDASEVFDLSLFGKVYAICDLLNNYHSLNDYDIRYYFNPITGLIEPIPIDNQNIYFIEDKGLIGENYVYKDTNKKLLSQNKFLEKRLFSNNKFLREYYSALSKIKDKSTLDKYFYNIKTERKKSLGILYKSYPWYKSDIEEILYNNQKYIEQTLNRNNKIYGKITNNINSENLINIKIFNKSKIPIQLDSITNSKKEILYLFDNDKILSNKTNNFISLNFKSNKLKRNIKDNNTLYINSKIIGTNINSKNLLFFGEQQKIIQKKISSLNNYDFIEINELNKSINFKEGFWNINKDIVIPEGYDVVIPKGTTLNFIDNSYLISYSRIIAIGNEKNIITIKSSDGSGKGVIILSAKGKSRFDFVLFDNLISKRSNYINSLGSLSAFDTNIFLKNVKFLNINAEDALNIVKSNFEISNSEFKNIKGDAIDSDFSKGFIQDVHFKDIGNDAIDISKSQVSSKNIKILNSGDKGISVGEKSDFSIDELNIDGAYIGIASKDKSIFIGENISLKNTFVGIAGYTKKPEFGPSYIKINNLINNKTSNKNLVEEDSILIIDDKKIDMKNSNVLRTLY